MKYLPWLHILRVWFPGSTPSLAHLSFDRVEDGLEASSDVELPENAAQVALDRFFTDGEVLTDFFIAAASSEVIQDLLLPGS